MSDETLLRLARCFWWEALQHGEPFGFYDRQQLAVTREECERRQVVDQFDALEREMRKELGQKGLLPRQRPAR